MELKNVIIWIGMCLAVYVAMSCDPNSDRYWAFEALIFGNMFVLAFPKPEKRKVVKRRS